jgi:cleavage and polyadenylation specificity factor subunit 1
MGAVLQQRVDNAWQPLAFLSNKLNLPQQKYSAYDRELLAVYEAVKHFRHMLEARHFIIFTHHKPSTYAFQQKRDKCSPRQFNYLDFIAQFSTDIRHIYGQDNVVADALSRVESVTAPPSDDALVASQDDDNELRTLLASSTALRLERQQIPGTTVSIYCDTSAGKPRLQVFEAVHDLSHPGTKAAAKLVAQRFVWPGMQKDYRAWARFAKPASAPKSPATQLLQWETLRCRQPVSFTSISTSWGLFQCQQATHTASLQLTASHAGQKPSPSRTSQPTPWHTP